MIGHKEAGMDYRSAERKYLNHAGEKESKEEQHGRNQTCKGLNQGYQMVCTKG